MGNFWQIGKGDNNANVDLEDIFCNLNIALIGPGKIGNYFDYKDEYKQQLNSKDLQFINDFCEKVQLDDVFVLRESVGQNEWHIIAIGKVLSPYRYEPIFSYVDKGMWDVQHCRRVLWHEIPIEMRTVISGGGIIGRISNMRQDNILRKEAERLINSIDELKKVFH